MASLGEERVTVGQLREELSKFPDDMPVAVASDGVQTEQFVVVLGRLLPKYLGERYRDQPQAVIIDGL